MGAMVTGEAGECEEEAGGYRPLEGRERVAVHEAGHVVACLAMGRSIVEAVVCKHEMRGLVRKLGHAEMGRMGEKLTKWTRFFVFREVMIDLSGVVAEAMVTGKLNWDGAKEDIETIRWGLCRVFPRSARLRKALLLALLEDTWRKLAPRQQSIEWVAAALMDRTWLSAEECRRVARGEQLEIPARAPRSVKKCSVGYF